MKRFLGLAIGLFFVIGFISSAEAIKIQQAEIDGGAVVVAGNQAARSAPITWEGVRVTTSNNGGVFRFTTSILPADCVGALSDGASAIEVVIASCMPALNRFLAPVPQTGQTMSYAAGDDGALQRGVALPTPRFTDNSNGTITDNLTGLIWLKNANCANTPNGTNWPQALADLANLNSFGSINGNNCGDMSNEGNHQTDWRMPNIRELQSLLNYAFLGPALSNAAGTGQATRSDPFSNLPSNPRYWSSTTFFSDASLGQEAWVILLDFGIVQFQAKIGDATFFLLVVRGGS